ncbi:MAG: hypothetical protein U1F14_17210 [Steroidobacteraceae bacterium]
MRAVSGNAAAITRCDFNTHGAALAVMEHALVQAVRSLPRYAPARARFAGSPAATAVAFEVMLEDPSSHRAAVHAPRASRLLAAGDSPATRTEIWMGGAHSHIGEELSHDSLASAWLIDCAGDMDPSFGVRRAAGLPVCSLTWTVRSPRRIA